MTFPTTPTFNSLSIKSNVSYVQSDTVNLRLQTRDLGGQRFEVSAGYPPMIAANFAPIWAYLAPKQAGTAFDIVLPRLSNQISAVSGTADVDGSFSAGVSSVDITGITGILKAGEYVKFSNHNKVYLVTADRNSGGPLSIFPDLRSPVTSSDTVIYQSVPMRVKIKTPGLQEYRHSLDKTIAFKLELIEAL